MKRIKAVVACDSFKGALSSSEAGNAIHSGILARLPDAEVSVFPVGDGGEGTAEALMLALDAERRYVAVDDTNREPVGAVYGIAVIGGIKTAVFDMAACAGIGFAKKHGLNLMSSSTYGVGQMIRHIAEEGISSIIIGLGGSGTSDGGAGALAALGAVFRDASGRIIEYPTTGSLFDIESCDLTSVVRDLKITLLYDSGVPLTGDNGAVMLYSRQKGADDNEVTALENAMKHYAAVTGGASVPGSGAAGGLGYGLSLAGGVLTPGAGFVLDAIGFDDEVRDCDIVFTGEGHTDYQTSTGKLPLAVAKRSAGKKTVCLCGADDSVQSLYENGMSAVFAIADRPLAETESMNRTAELLTKCAYNIIGLI